eukprot:TRINITY_DN53866_c0_g1_i1.p1 TRINITY_DN53866_c0_g1~~TRINITY_DN53866_c0_g1_i1.p1  ORF type:complete len:111 (-),score=1.98 TRINITY_DN53866_c0_g1_i1:298-630(-)
MRFGAIRSIRKRLNGKSPERGQKPNEDSSSSLQFRCFCVGESLSASHLCLEPCRIKWEYRLRVKYCTSADVQYRYVGVGFVLSWGDFVMLRREAYGVFTSRTTRLPMSKS